MARGFYSTALSRGDLHMVHTPGGLLHPFTPRTGVFFVQSRAVCISMSSFFPALTPLLTLSFAIFKKCILIRAWLTNGASAPLCIHLSERASERASRATNYSAAAALWNGRWIEVL